MNFKKITTYLCTLVIFSLICISAVFTACKENIGLGQSVDTESPTIKIDYPPTGAIIRKSFVLGGTWTDDKGVTGITIKVFKKESDNSTVQVYDGAATVSVEDKQWYSTLNAYDNENAAYYNGWQFADGNYEVTVTAIDSAKHTADFQRSFTIDNTAPVLVLTKPTTVGSNTPKSYGRSVQLEGTFSEQCSSGISNLIVSIYDAAGQKLLDSSFKNITDMSGANPLTIATYYNQGEEPDSSDEASLEKWNNYKKLYGEDAIQSFRTDGNGLTKVFYFAVTASDAACVYNDFANRTETAGGNSTSEFYRGTTEMLKLINSKNSAFKDFSVTKLRQYINQTDSTFVDSDELKSIVASSKSPSVTNSTVESIASSISHISTDDGDVFLNYTINPENNPSYNLGGMGMDFTSSDTEKYTDGFYNYFTESNINLTVTPGLDLTNLDTSTISVFYTKVDADLNVLGEKQLLWTWNEAVAVEYAIASGISEYLAAQHVKLNPAACRYTVTTEGENSDGLSVQTSLSIAKGEIEANSHYVFSIEGTDINGQKIIPSDDDGFGFVSKSNSKTPTIIINQEAGKRNLKTASIFTESVLTDGTFGFDGTINSSEALQDGAVTYTLKLSDANDAEDSAQMSGNIDLNFVENTTFSYTWTKTFTANGSMTSIIQNGSGVYNVEFTISAQNAGGTSSQNRQYYLDSKDPEENNVAISTGYTASDGTIFINNTKTFSLSGTTIDNFNRGLTSYKFTGIDSNGDEKILTQTTAQAETGWLFENLSLADFAPQSNVPDTVLIVTAYDAAGNSKETEYKVEFDTIAPAGKHLIDKKNKDLIFRVGESNNETAEITAASLTWDDALDKDVGGKYQVGTWGTARTITIRGDFTEDGSGVNMIYYKIYDEVPTETDLNNFLTHYATTKDGYFSPLAERVSHRVSYTKADGTKAFEEIESLFKTTISGFDAKNNYLALVAVDNVGNAGLDSIYATSINDTSAEASNAWNDSASFFSLNIDTESPTLSSTTSGTQYTNKVNEITVEGTVNDNASGISSVVLTLNGQNVTGTITTSGALSSGWNATIPTSLLQTLGDGTYNVNATVKDAAGNSSASTIFTLQVDATSPVPTITTPLKNASINGSISVTGSVTYTGASPASLALYYTIEDPSLAQTPPTLEDLTQFGSTITDPALIYSYKFENVNVYDVFGEDTASATKDVWLIPVVTDTAGNCNIYTEDTSHLKTYSYTLDTNYFKYTVDRDSDRPIIRLINLNMLSDGSYILKYGTNATLEGTISDDDSTSTAAVKHLYITEDAPYTGTGDAPSSASRVSLGADGSFTYTPASTHDGTKNLYFYIEDNSGAKFYTNNATAYLMPKIQYKSETAADNDAVLTYRSDSTAPSIADTQVQSYDNTQTSNGASVTPGTSLIVGGKDRQYVQFIIKGKDANGIEGMLLTLKYKDSSDGDAYIRLTNINSTDYTSRTVEGETLAFTYDSNGTSILSENNTITTWTTSLIDLSVAKTGSITCSIEVYDTSGLSGNASPVFMVDNDGPDVRITTPSSNDEVTGDIKIGGNATDVGLADTYITKWLIPNSTQRAMTDEQLIALVDGEGNSVWNHVLDANTTETSWSFTIATDEAKLYDTSDYYLNATVDKVYTLPFYVLAIDNRGNYTLKKNYTFKHNPDGDRPKTSITFPTDGLTLGGTIRVNGDAYIPSGTTNVAAVFIQIAKKTSEGKYEFGSDDKTLVSGATNFEGLVNTGGFGYSVMDSAAVKSELGVTKLIFGDEDSSGSSTLAASWWGIKATKTSSSWYIQINNEKELDPAAGETNDLAIRACAVNAEGKMGTWSDTYTFSIDATAPTQAATLCQYYRLATQEDVSAGTATEVGQLIDTQITSANAKVDTPSVKAIKTYEAQMYLKGSWYLAVKLEDESELATYTVKNNLQVTNLIADTDYFVSNVATADSGAKSQYLYIPVDTTTEYVTYTVSVTDSQTSGHTLTTTYELRIDNTAPDITAVYKGDELASDSSNLIGQNYTITDSNYVFTLGGKTEETGSGLERVAFYYIRQGDDFTNECIMDPLITTGTSDAKVALSDLTERTIRQGDNSISMWALPVTGTMKGYNFVADSDLSTNSHIRVGGLIEVGGVYRRIESIANDGKTIGFNTSTGVTEDTSTTAYFPYAQVVDNTGTEKTSSTTGTTFAFSSGDDGDLMPESVSGSKSVGYIWDATIHSGNIADGPAKLVIIAFDKAENVSCTTYTVNIANSAPRLAKAYLGTDLNSNGSFTAGEFVGYDVYHANATAGINTTEVRDVISIATANFGGEHFIAKDKLAVVPEIVGGNGNIIMVYKKGADDTTQITTENGTTAAVDNTITGVITDTIGSVTYKKAATSTVLKAFTLTSKQLAGLAETDSLTSSANEASIGASFTFWDSTDETTPGSTSQFCVLHVSDLELALYDGVAPTAKIQPFYWNSKDDNSLYQNSKNNGHIELESDWLGANGYDSEATTGEFDKDPKVSGTIVIKGSAYDNKMLKNIALKIDGFKLDGTNAGGEFTFATFNGTSWDKTNGSGESPVAGGSLANDGWIFDISDNSLGQDGHSVNWTLTLDTSKVSTVVTTTSGTETLDQVALDSVALVKATDSNSNASDITSAAALTQTVDGALTPRYRMDIVPYITKVSTSLGNLKQNNPTVYSRTAKGHYPVYLKTSDTETTGETVTLTGFNLGATTTITISDSTVSGDYNHSFYVDTDGDAGDEYFEIISLNNKNNNDSYGSAYTSLPDTGDTGNYSIYNEYFYNRQPNNDNNNLLTDDVVLDVWEIDSTAVKPKVGAITQPVMAIDPANDNIGFAFINGTAYFSMPYGTNSKNVTPNSYEYWIGGLDEWNSISLTYDINGYSYATAAGGDLNTSKNGVDIFRFTTSRWNGKGTLSTNGYTDLNNQFGLEYIGEREYFYDESQSKWADFTNFSKSRIKSPSLATVASSTDTSQATVYLAYYDSINDEIRFNWGIIKDTQNNSKTGMFDTHYGTERSSKAYSISGTSLIAGQTIDKAISTTPTYASKPVTTEAGVAVYGGEYVSIAAIPDGGDSDDAVVAVWWDGTNHKMLYSYNKKPKSIALSEYTQEQTEWSAPEELFPQEVGEYCKVTVDASSGVHIAAYDSTNGDIWYAYLKDYDVPSSAKTGYLDSNGFVGSELNIDVALVNNKAVPCVSYYASNAAKPKIARWVGGDLSQVESVSGSVDDAFTSNWDISYIPTSSKLIFDHINVAVWKNKDGTLKESVTGTKNFQAGSGATVNSYGTVWGNGTENPVLGYATKSGSLGYIETAQMR